VRVLGRLELHRDGVPVVAPELRRERVRQLLAFLLTHDRPTRSAITAELWPDLDEAAAGKNLRVTLAYLNNLLEPERGDLEAPYFVRSAHGCLQFVADEAIEIDSRRFEEHLDEAARLERQGVPSAALAAYLDACALWRGEFFADVTADDWLQWERDRLRGRFVTAAVRAGNLLLARGEPDPAGQLADRALVADPWAEPAYQLLISVALAVGDLARADRELRRCQRALRELGAPAQQRTVALARQLRAAQ
jgi:DNA-binding SARP family transcriptional activator